MQRPLRKWIYESETRKEIHKNISDKILVSRIYQ